MRPTQLQRVLAERAPANRAEQRAANSDEAARHHQRAVTWWRRLVSVATSALCRRHQLGCPDDDLSPVTVRLVDRCGICSGLYIPREPMSAGAPAGTRAQASRTAHVLNPAGGEFAVSSVRPRVSSGADGHLPVGRTLGYDAA